MFLINKFLKILILFLLMLIHVACGDVDLGGTDVTDSPFKKPFLVCATDADYFLIYINGVEDMTPSPLEYIVENLSQGIYIVQIKAVNNGVVDYPVDFNLIVIDYPTYISYEVFPKDGYEQFFNPDNLIVEIPKQ